MQYKQELSLDSTARLEKLIVGDDSALKQQEGPSLRQKTQHKLEHQEQNATTEEDLSMFFNRACQFYTYFGCTTPFCRQAVQWLTLRETIKVKERPWNQLTLLELRGDFNFRFGNYRNIQPLNNRVIVANFPREPGPVLPSPNDQFIPQRSEIFGNPDRGAKKRQRKMRIPNPVFENTVMQARGPMFLKDPIHAQSRIMNDKRSTVRSRMLMLNALQASRNIGIRGQSLLMPPAGPSRRVNMAYKPMIREAERFITTDYWLPPRSIYSRGSLR